MPAGGPAGHDKPARIAAERGQSFDQKIDPSVDFGNDLIERGIGCQRIANQRDIDAMRHRAFGKQREDFLGAPLPIAAMDEQERRAAVGGFEKVDAITLARAIAEVQMAGMPRTHVGRTPLPAGNDVGAASHRDAIVEAEVAILLAHAAPVGRIKRRGHV